jgi:hypothetical protein
MDTRLTAPRKEKALQTTVRKEIEALRQMTLSQLRQKHAEVFGDETRSHHKHFLFRRIAWRIQALAEGDLSERARRRALEIGVFDSQTNGNLLYWDALTTAKIVLNGGYGQFGAGTLVVKED